jgi:hypothetical protein
MRFLAVLTTVTAIFLGVVVVAHASALSVDAGVLQTIRQDAPEFEPPASVEVKVQLRFYNQQSNRAEGHDKLVMRTLQVGTAYRIEYTDGGHRACGSDAGAQPGEMEIPLGSSFEFESTHPTTHLLCVQHTPPSGSLSIVSVDEESGSRGGASQ